MSDWRNPTRDPAPLQATLTRILAGIKSRTQEEVTYRCARCEDSGIEDITSGFHKTVGGVSVDASEVRLARPCRGMRGNGCAWSAWKSSQQAERPAGRGRAKAL